MIKRKRRHEVHYDSSANNTKALRRVNNFLTVLVVATAGYVLITPYAPNISLWWHKKSDKTSGYVYRSALAEEVVKDNQALAPRPKDNRLVIPKIQLDQAIIEGNAPNTVDKGVWRRPATSKPSEGSNTVLVGHRFTYADPATFYHLDKLAIGDKFTVFWEGVEYNYEVSEIKTVLPTAIEVEAPTDEPRMTLYTCTPLLTATHRLVVVSKLIGRYE